MGPEYLGPLRKGGLPRCWVRRSFSLSQVSRFQPKGPLPRVPPAPPCPANSALLVPTVAVQKDCPVSSTPVLNRLCPQRELRAGWGRSS